MPDKPNILILMPDQQRADAMGCAGNARIKTPNIDRIAREGIRFDSVYTVSPLCMPARASFISGIYPHNHHIWQNAGQLPRDDETFFHHLQKEGYFTVLIGKSHFYHPEPGQHLAQYENYMHARGLDYLHETTGPWATLKVGSYMRDYWGKKGLFELFKKDYVKRKEYEFHDGHRKKRIDKVSVYPSPLSEEEFLDSYIGRKALEFIRSYNKNKPLCLFVGFGGPHEPWDAPGRYASMYETKDMPASIPAGSLGDWVPQEVVERLEFEKIAEKISKENIQKIRANYYGKISLIDYWIGEILSVFERIKGPENTLVVFWSDHGEMLGDHQVLYKSVFYESSISVPLLIRWPSHIQGGEKCKALVEVIDVYPTLLEVAGAEPSQRCFGKSLWPLLRNPENNHRQAVFSEISFAGHHNVMIRTLEYKYAVDETGAGFLLYNLQNDPLEQNNLIGHPEMGHIEDWFDNLILSFLIEKQVRFK